MYDESGVQSKNAQYAAAWTIYGSELQEWKRLLLQPLSNLQLIFLRSIKASVLKQIISLK